MSTPEHPQPPGELSLVDPTTRHPPSVSPGVSAAVVRSPTAPTVPDADPAGLTLAISHIANALFGAPSPAVPEAPSTTTALPTTTAPSLTTTSAPPAPPPTTTMAPPTTASPPHPFLGAPDWSLLSHAPAGDGIPGDFSLPLFDDVDARPSTTAAPTATRAPLTTAPHAPSVPSTSPTLATPAWEVRPLVDTGISPQRGAFDAHALKAEFPILRERVHGKPLVWLDNAATTQKPQAVIDRISRFYAHENSNIHRAAHTLAARATDAYEAARESVRRFVNAPSVRDVIFVRGTTEGINLVAQSWGRRHIESGDEIVLTWLEHHANIVPWQLLARETGARLRVAPVDDNGQIILEEYERLLGPRTKLVSLTQVSNALGTVTPAAQMIELARRRGIKVLLDGAQSVSHLRVDLQALRPDFFVFSGHKVFGPTGIGVVVADAAMMDETPPWQGGGNMIQDVTFERTVFQPSPARFEAGTGNIADAVGLGAALDWVGRVGIENIGRHEHELLAYGTERLLQIPGLRIVGTAAEKAGVLSFVIAGHETQAISAALDKEGIAVRGGHHCAQPILRRFGLESTVRASLAPYNTFEDLDALEAALRRIIGLR
jgi:cysteine desulfurase/selenocysteine lyase